MDNPLDRPYFVYSEQHGYGPCHADPEVAINVAQASGMAPFTLMKLVASPVRYVQTNGKFSADALQQSEQAARNVGA